MRALAAFTVAILLGVSAYGAAGGFLKPPVVRVTAAVAMEMCGHIEFVVVTKSNGDSTLVLDPSREAIELLDKTIADPNRKQAVHFKCPSSAIL